MTTSGAETTVAAMHSNALPDPAGAVRRGLIRIVTVAGLLTAAACATSGEASPASGPTSAAVPTTTRASASATASAAPSAAPPVAVTTVRGAPPAPAGPPRCTTGELTGSLVGGEGAAGTVHRALVLTNSGKRTCELTGFPGVSYVAGDDGHQVGPAAAMSGARGAPVRLAAGAAATADVGVVQVLNFDAAVCKPTPVRGLRVYPPGDTASLFVAAGGTGCAGTPPGPQLTVTTLGPR